MINKVRKSTLLVVHYVHIHCASSSSSFYSFCSSSTVRVKRQSEAAPLTATAANLYAPGSGDAIMQGVDGLHGLRGAGGGAKKAIDIANKVARSGKKGRKDLIVQFGDQLDNTTDKVNRSKQLLRDAKNSKYTVN